MRMTPASHSPAVRPRIAKVNPIPGTLGDADGCRRVAGPAHGTDLVVVPSLDRNARRESGCPVTRRAIDADGTGTRRAA
jgi:hypothetical protein